MNGTCFSLLYVRNVLILQVQNLGEATSKFIDEGLDKKAIADLQDAFQVN
jgi:hypothetical protein